MLLRPIPQGSSDSLGLAERTIRSVNNHIRRLVPERGWKKFPEVLPLVEMIMRNARREDVNLSPAEIAFGFRPRGPWTNDLPQPTNGLTPLQMWTLARREQRTLRQQMDREARQKIREDTTRPSPTEKFKPGDLVRRRIKISRDTGMPRKWWPQYKEVWRVVDHPGPHRFVCVRVHPPPARLAVLDGRLIKKAFPTGKEIDV